MWIQVNYWLFYSNFASEYPGYVTACFWIYGVTTKIFPSFLLLVMTSRIMLAMHRAKKRRVGLLGQKGLPNNDARTAQHNRTTWMIIAVVVFFIITQLPQGILALISGFDEVFLSNVYSNLGDLMDLLTLVNSAVNIIIYCTMSKQFRTTFTNVLFVSLCRRQQQT